MSRWLYVDNRIAALSLSVLAVRMRERRPQIKHTSSDEALCFGVAFKSEMNKETYSARRNPARWNQEARLAAAMVRTQIPGDIGELPLDEYLEIRKRYAECRDIFHLAMAEIERLYLDRTFTTEHEFEAAIQDQLRAFATGVEKIKERAETKIFRKWSTITLQRLVPVVAAAAASLFGVPPVAAAGAGAAVSYGLDFFKERAGQGGSGTYIHQAQALFASLTRDLSGEGWMARVFV
jgi:hypothetical protein